MAIRSSSSESDLTAMSSRISVAGFRDGKAIIIAQNGLSPEPIGISSPDFRRGEYQTGLWTHCKK